MITIKRTLPIGYVFSENLVCSSSAEQRHESKAFDFIVIASDDPIHSDHQSMSLSMSHNCSPHAYCPTGLTACYTH